jgi:hypothetical protein
MKPQLIIALTVLIPAVAAAQSSRSYPCTQGSLTRRVEVAYSSSAEVPCEVRYFKESESSPQVLWSATTQSGYCEAQARDFVARLQGMGWVCSDSGTSDAPAAAQAPRAGDDTEVLEAAGGTRD